MEKITVECDKCGIVLSELASTPFEKRKPCPECGSLIRMIRVTLADSITLIPMLRGKLRDSSGKIIMKLKSFKEYYRRLHKWQNTSYVVNRRDDKYDKIVTDPNTGKVLYECHEPLIRHKGHSNAKTADR